MYVPWLLNFVQKINFFPGWTAITTSLFVLITKFSDTGAYAVGSLIGKHKMIPRISPGKTWKVLAEPSRSQPWRALFSLSYAATKCADDFDSRHHS